jgi:hypothetical protein
VPQLPTSRQLPLVVSQASQPGEQINEHQGPSCVAKPLREPADGLSGHPRLPPAALPPTRQRAAIAWGRTFVDLDLSAARGPASTVAGRKPLFW